MAQPDPPRIPHRDNLVAEVVLPVAAPLVDKISDFSSYGISVSSQESAGGKMRFTKKKWTGGQEIQAAMLGAGP